MTFFCRATLPGKQLIDVEAPRDVCEALSVAVAGPERVVSLPYFDVDPKFFESPRMKDIGKLDVDVGPLHHHF